MQTFVAFCVVIVFGLVAMLSWASKPFVVQWEPLNSQNRPNCSAKSPCRVFQDGLTYDFIINAKTVGSKKVFEKLLIKNNTNGRSQEFVLDTMRNLDDDEYFEFFKTQLRPGKNVDVALAAFSSAREGRVYYYFLYDEKSKSFIMSDGTFPKLVSSKSGVGLESELQGTPFKIDESLKIVNAQAMVK